MTLSTAEAEFARTQLAELNTPGAKVSSVATQLAAPSTGPQLTLAETQLAVSKLPNPLGGGTAAATSSTDTTTPAPGQVPTQGTGDNDNANTAQDGTEVAEIVPTAEQQATADAARKVVFDAAKPVNSISIASILAQPKARVLAGGKIFAGVVRFHVTSNNFLGADTWSLELATGLDAERDAAWWAEQIDIQIEIQIATTTDNGQADYKSLIIGILDELDIDQTDFTISLQGRDMSARLIDTEVVDSYSNLKASEIAKKFAEEHGLTADVVESPGNAGANYDASGNKQVNANSDKTSPYDVAETDENGNPTDLSEEENTTPSTTAMAASEFSHALSKWDFLAHHASREGYDLWVDGTTLHYRPRAKPDKTNVWGVVFKPGTSSQIAANIAVRGITSVNATKLVTKRRAYLAKDIMVSVVSVNSTTGAVIRVRVRGNHIKSGEAAKPQETVDKNGVLYEDGKTATSRYSTVDSNGVLFEGTAADARILTPEHNDNRVIRYSFNEPDQTRTQALAFAQAKLHELTSHERTCSFSIPGETAMHARLLVKLEGTGSSFDQLYYISTITRSFSLNDFGQHVELRNSSPRDMPGAVTDDENLVPGAASNTGTGGNTAGSNNLGISEPRASAAQKAARDARISGRPTDAVSLEPGSIPLSASKEQVIAAVRQQAKFEGVDPDFAERIVRQESGGNLIRNGAYIEGPMTKYGSALGPMQMLSSTAQEMGVNPRDPASSIIGGVRYLGAQQDRFGTNQTAIAAAYNWGPGSAAKWISAGADPAALPAETRGYVKATAR